MAFGRFERARDDKPLSDINMTPLIDVMLVLLVILLLTAPLLGGSIGLNLPRVDAVPGPASPDALVLTLRRDGSIELDGQAVAPSRLGSVLRARASKSHDVELRVLADSAVPYGDVARVMAAAQAAGLARVGLVTQSARASAPR